VKSLDSSDSHHLSAAEGWIGLGNWQQANSELEKIAPGFQAHPDVLEIRLHVYVKAGKWEPCVDIGNALVRAVPERPYGWIQRSSALHELKRTQEAFDYLLPVAKQFPKEWIIPYDLACYCAQLGRLEECKDWFTKAVGINERSVQLEAIDDPDLKPLLDSLIG
jgi:tetratricopeptide (TPR) repeat protein